MENKDFKISKIYEKIADKTLSFGCKLKEKYEWKDYMHIILQLINEKENSYYVKTLDGSWNFNKNKIEIIGHPVMIGDFIGYLDETVWQDRLIDGELKKITEGFDYFGTVKDISILWKYKRKPIEEQSEECIDYVFNLLPKE